MRIGVIGTGTVGTNLARGLAAAGHDVTLGTRDPTDGTVRELADELGGEATDVATAAERGEAVVLAVPASVAPELAEANADALAGDDLVDPTNSLSPADPGSSIADRIAEAAPGAHVAKAFNTVGAEWFTDPVVDGQPATMFVCGDDPAAATAGALAEDLGFHVVDTGDRSAAFHLENLARFWIVLSRSRGRGMAFRLIGEDA